MVYCRFREIVNLFLLGFLLSFYRPDRNCKNVQNCIFRLPAENWGRGRGCKFLYNFCIISAVAISKFVNPCYNIILTGKLWTCQVGAILSDNQFGCGYLYCDRYLGIMQLSPRYTDNSLF
jgi:hypothetical protein